MFAFVLSCSDRSKQCKSAHLLLCCLPSTEASNVRVHVCFVLSSSDRCKQCKSTRLVLRRPVLTQRSILEENICFMFPTPTGSDQTKHARGHVCFRVILFRPRQAT